MVLWKAVFAVTPRNFDRIFNPITRFLKKHGSQIIAVVFFLVGISLIAQLKSSFKRFDGGKPYIAESFMSV
jgi:predicted RND superfamily exporter protein